MELTQVLEWLGLFTAGGAISGVATFKYTLKKAREEAKQLSVQTEKDIINSAQDAANQQIENANKLIEMYRQSLEDRTKLSQQHEEQLLERITDLEKQQRESQKTIQSQSNLLAQYKQQITDMSRTINELKLEVTSVKRQNEHDCRYCRFTDVCDRYKALVESGKLVCKVSENDSKK